MSKQKQDDGSEDDSVAMAAEDYARRCFEATGQPFAIGELINLKAWFYAGARWRHAHPHADVVGPQSHTMSVEDLQTKVRALQTELATTRQDQRKAEDAALGRLYASVEETKRREVAEARVRKLEQERDGAHRLVETLICQVEAQQAEIDRLRDAVRSLCIEQEYFPTLYCRQCGSEWNTEEPEQHKVDCELRSWLGMQE